MPLGLRHGIANKPLVPTYLNWLQSDGVTGYVDTGYVVGDYRTKISVVASGLLDFVSVTTPLVMAGMTVATNAGDIKSGFGFLAVYPDRQIYIRVGKSRWWNATGNQGNWTNGDMHSIDIGLTDENNAFAMVDGILIPMTNESSASISEYPRTPPSYPQTIFASNYNGGIYMINSAYKVRSIRYSLDDIVLANFRAAELDGLYGFYNDVAKEFHPANGTLVSGGELED